MKKVVRREFLRIAAAAALVCAAASLTGCGQNVEKLVVGDWYLEGSDRLRFTIYNDIEHQKMMKEKDMENMMEKALGHRQGFHDLPANL